MIQVSIRFDDPSGDSDHALERRILHELARHGVRATFAVVPCPDGRPLDAAAVPHLCEAHAAGLIEVAQHGYDHTDRHAGNGQKSEFAGLPAEEQARRIAAGKDALERVFGTAIDGFVPPFNTFDRATAGVLRDLGFAYLSAGWEQEAIRIDGLAPLPRTCQIGELMAAVRAAQSSARCTQAIVAVMHHYDFAEHAGNPGRLRIEEFGQLLAWLRARPQVGMATLADLARSRPAGDWTAAVRRRQRLEWRYWRLAPFLPRRSLMLHGLWRYLRLPVRAGR